jgi:hypothetical protein
MLKYLDGYTLRARLAPAIIAAAPAFAFVALLMSWSQLSISNTIATLGLAVLLFALSDLARARGKRIEPVLFNALGGKPSVMMLRFADDSFDRQAKTRYLAFLAGKLSESAPTEDDERRDPAAADAFYDRCGAWLRENTRNGKKFSILFNENVSYGYRRNLFALKWPALALNGGVVLLCGWVLVGGEPFAALGALKSRVMVVLAVAAIHALYIGFAINQRLVAEAARSYARQLILSCESFLGNVKQTAAKPKNSPRRTRGVASA